MDLSNRKAGAEMYTDSIACGSVLATLLAGFMSVVIVLL